MRPALLWKGCWQAGTCAICTLVPLSFMTLPIVSAVARMDFSIRFLISLNSIIPLFPQLNSVLPSIQILFSPIKFRTFLNSIQYFPQFNSALYSIQLFISSQFKSSIIISFNSVMNFPQFKSVLPSVQFINHHISQFNYLLPLIQFCNSLNLIPYSTQSNSSPLITLNSIPPRFL